MKERLIEFLAYLNISQKKFEENVGLSNGFVDKVGDSIRTNNLNKISAIYPDLNLNWLKTGEGEMIKSVITQNNVDGDNIQGYNVNIKKTETEKLLDLLKTKDEQINRLIGIIEKSNK
ncbi:MAG: hypothetical protein LBG18_07805 [Mediterranea sp.]|jgi:DNA-binding Xre family transcriptional regulator|nr:hypothetical protein [Mediterranea sp.]